MSVSNDIRRLRNKLKILEMDGSGQLLDDIIKLKQQSPETSNQRLITILKNSYELEINKLVDKGKFKQGKLNL